MTFFSIYCILFDMTKEDLLDNGYENIVVFENPDYGDSIIGVDINNRAVYSYDKMVENLMKKEKMSEEDAIDFIDYNTVGFHIEGGPIIVFCI